MKKTIELKISGMHCQSCEKLIAQELAELNGVIDSKINYSSGRGLVSFESDKISEAAIIGAVKNAGYESEIISAENNGEGGGFEGRGQGAHGQTFGGARRGGAFFKNPDHSGRRHYDFRLGLRLKLPETCALSLRHGHHSYGAPHGSGLLLPGPRVYYDRRS
ncbi:MAG: P-type transport ATPase (Probable substrate copper/metal cation) [Parcubacteria group bacterium GW2011_GWA1_47_9]|nr:MAG: P-type transport ATPase (Probable substrate copper/metal cation) [Parcubacteria group bacterium GW2011_GWA1_47_9]